MQAKRLADVVNVSALDSDDTIIVSQNKTIKQIKKSDLFKDISVDGDAISTNTGKTAIYYNTGNYTIPKGGVDTGTTWDTEKHNDCEIVYVDGANNKDGFRVPYAGTYQIISTIILSLNEFPTGVKITGNINNNGQIKDSIVELCDGMTNMSKIHFVFEVEAQANDVLSLTIAQDSGVDATILGDYSRLFITYLG